MLLAQLSRFGASFNPDCTRQRQDYWSYSGKMHLSGQRSEVRQNKTCPTLDASSLKKKKKKEKRAAGKTSPSTVSPCALCTRAFCFSAAAGPG